METKRLGLRVLSRHARDGLTKEGEIINPHIPKWYWITLLAFEGVGIGGFLICVLGTLILRMEWVSWDGQTLFTLGAGFGFILTFTSGWMLVIGLAVFPYTIESKESKK